MSSCCRCSRNGRCKNCCCVKMGRKCTGCLPLSLGCCQNRGDRVEYNASTTDSANQGDLRQDSTNNIERPHEPPASSTRRMNDLPGFPTPLPPYLPSNQPNAWWGNHTGESLTQEINSCYESMGHWKKFLFSVPRGTEGENFVKATTRLLHLYADKSGLENIGLKAAMIFPSLMLMKPSRKSKMKDERSCLKRRLQLWEEGEIRQLRNEAEALQRRYVTSASPPKAQPIARRFGNLLRKGKVKDTMRLLKENTQKPLKSSDIVNGKTVLEILQEKHPEGRPLNPDVLSQSESPHTDFHPIVFEGIDASLVRSSALKVKGSAGPSGLDAHQWRRLCTSFGHYSDDLCDAVAAITRRLCTEYVDPNAIESLTACRLIALNQNPGVRPIGVAETLRRIMGKAILSIISDDIQRAAGSIQLCAGQISGIEAAIHAMNIAFEDDGVEAAILVDASNAFNNLNREAALRNIHKVCPALAVIATNTYQKTSIDSNQSFNVTLLDSLYYIQAAWGAVNQSTLVNCFKTSNLSSKTRGAPAPRTRITWVSLLGLEEPSLKLSRSSELQRTNSSPISNCRRSKSAIFISPNINYNINSLLLLRVGIRIIYILDERYIPEVEMKTI